SGLYYGLYMRHIPIQATLHPYTTLFRSPRPTTADPQGQRPCQGVRLPVGTGEPDPAVPPGTAGGHGSRPASRSWPSSPSVPGGKIGRGPVLTPVTFRSCMASSDLIKKT